MPSSYRVQTGQKLSVTTGSQAWTIPSGYFYEASGADTDGVGEVYLSRQLRISNIGTGVSYVRAQNGSGTAIVAGVNCSVIIPNTSIPILLTKLDTHLMYIGDATSTLVAELGSDL